MNTYLEKISKSFNNPFLLGLIIVGILNLMFYITVQNRGAKKNNIKTLMRSFFYQYIMVTFILYLHHAGLEKEFKSSYESNLNLNLVSRVGAQDKIIQPEKIDIFSPTASNNENENDEDTFI